MVLHDDGGGGFWRVGDWLIWEEPGGRKKKRCLGGRARAKC